MIKQAIIPLAGQGTRLLPLTSVLPKELLPINGKPGLEYIIDECIGAGIKEVILVISARKRIIKTYFYNDAFLKTKFMSKIMESFEDPITYLDFDLYEPTKAALAFIENCINVGGVIIFDEACIKEWPGETTAMKEFLENSKHRYEMLSNTISHQPTVALRRLA